MRKPLHELVLPNFVFDKYFDECLLPFLFMKLFWWTSTIVSINFILHTFYEHCTIHFRASTTRFRQSDISAGYIYTHTHIWQSISSRNRYTNQLACRGATPIFCSVLLFHPRYIFYSHVTIKYHHYIPYGLITGKWEQVEVEYETIERHGMLTACLLDWMLTQVTVCLLDWMLTQVTVCLLDWMLTQVTVCLLDWMLTQVTVCLLDWMLTQVTVCLLDWMLTQVTVCLLDWMLTQVTVCLLDWMLTQVTVCLLLLHGMLTVNSMSVTVSQIW